MQKQIKIFQSLSSEEKKTFTVFGTTIAIGNFDGCHLGHQNLLNRALQLGKKTQTHTIALFFHPHPRAFFRKEQTSRLFSLEQKIRAFTEMGFDGLFIQDFNKEFSQLSPTDFFQKILQNTLHAQNIVVGENFLFGKDRQGSAKWLKENAPISSVEIVHLSATHNIPLSSSKAIEALKSGKIDELNKILGRPYLLEGKILKDTSKNSSDFLSASISSEQILPCKGIYTGFVWTAANPAPILNIPKNLLQCVIEINDTTKREIILKVDLLQEKITPGKFIGIYFNSAK